MKESWRWFGPLDVIPLHEVAQTGARVVVTALHEVPYGEVWSVDAIRARQRLVADAGVGLSWEVVESLPVHDDIKRGTGDLDRHLRHHNRQYTAWRIFACLGGATRVLQFQTELLDHRNCAPTSAVPAPSVAALRCLRRGQRWPPSKMHMLRSPGRRRRFSRPVRQAAGTRCFEASSQAERDLARTINAELPAPTNRYYDPELRAPFAQLERLRGRRPRAGLREVSAEMFPSGGKISQ